MSAKLRPWFLSLATAAMLVATGAPVFADGVVDPAPIGPDQTFVGLVNGVTGSATIKMACYGPVLPGQTGHPQPDQSVSVRPVTGPISYTSGNTGSAADRVIAGFGLTSATNVSMVMTSWVVPTKIPITLVLPCYGTGTATFTPYPTSPTARAATVHVTFVGQP